VNLVKIVGIVFWHLSSLFSFSTKIEVFLFTLNGLLKYKKSIGISASSKEERLLSVENKGIVFSFSPRFSCRYS
jgi:hypothetical protein